MTATAHERLDNSILCFYVENYNETGSATFNDPSNEHRVERERENRTKWKQQELTSTENKALSFYSSSAVGTQLSPKKSCSTSNHQ